MNEAIAPISLTDGLQYFVQLENLAESVDIYLKSNAQEQWEKVSQTPYRLSPRDFVKSLAERRKYWELAVIFPNTLWSSIFSSAYALLEHTLTSYCKELYRGTIPKTKERGIFRVKHLLNKAPNARFPSDNQNWTFIVACNPIRNCLSHCSGNIDDSKDHGEIRKFMKVESSLKEADGYLYVQKEFVDKFLRSGNAFIELLLGLNHSVKG